MVLSGQNRKCSCCLRRRTEDCLFPLPQENPLDFETSEDVEIVGSFDSMGLKDELLRGIYAYGAHTFSVAV